MLRYLTVVVTIRLDIIEALSIFIFGSPPIHYYIPVIIPIVVLVSLFINKLILTVRFPVLFFPFVIFMINTSFYWSEKWFLKDYNFNKVGAVSYLAQKDISKKIVSDSNGLEYNLRRVGAFDYYDGDYAQNYRYLLWLYGNEPVDYDTVNNYIIYEDKEKYKGEDTIIFETENLLVVKERV